jgi:hypothetical protein
MLNTKLEHNDKLYCKFNPTVGDLFSHDVIAFVCITHIGDPKIGDKTEDITVANKSLEKSS